MKLAHKTSCPKATEIPSNMNAKAIISEILATFSCCLRYTQRISERLRRNPAEISKGVGLTSFTLLAFEEYLQSINQSKR